MLPYGNGSGAGDPSYPFAAPSVRFTPESHLVHYAIDSDGEVCLPLIADGWSPTTRLVEVLDQLQTLIVSPEDIDADAKYSKQMILSNQLRSNKKLYVKICAASARRAPPADGGDASSGAKRVAKLQQTPSMLGLFDEMRYLKKDRIRPPKKRPVNAQPGWPYSQWQPLLNKVWLGGGSNAHHNDVLKPFCREERWKRILMLPMAIPFLITNNLVKKISWFCLILRSLDGLGIFDDMYVACSSYKKSSRRIT